MNARLLNLTAFVLAPFFFSFDIVIDNNETGRKKLQQAKANIYSQTNSLSDALTFHVSFDQKPDADFGLGDQKIYTGDFKGSRQQDEIPTTAGLGNPPLLLAKGKGKYGGALEFTKVNSHVVFYKLDKNVHYTERDFNGSVSLWMSFDPDEIPEKYCDPFQLTDKYYASDAIWVDVTKNDVPPDLRLGVLGDERVWDVNKLQGRAEQFFWHLLKVSNPPFQKGKWTHVVVTWELNGPDIGRAKLYLDGEYQGQSGPIREPFLWDTSKVTMRLGTGKYIGLMDDISLFRKALTPNEIRTLFNLKNGVSQLHP